MYKGKYAPQGVQPVPFDGAAPTWLKKVFHLFLCAVAVGFMLAIIILIAGMVGVISIEVWSWFS
jgi:hypothetical protein